MSLIVEIIMRNGGVVRRGEIAYQLERAGCPWAIEDLPGLLEDDQIRVAEGWSDDIERYELGPNAPGFDLPAHLLGKEIPMAAIGSRS